MRPIIRKTPYLPPNLDEIDLYAIRERLKAHPKRPESERVLGILELLYALGSGPAKTKRPAIIAALSKSLRLYSWVSIVSPHGEIGRTVLRPDPNNASGVGTWEYQAVRDLLDILDWPGALSRIRKCESCGEWLFAAKRNDQRFCEGKCRQKNYDTDPAHKARRREIQRANDAAERARTEAAEKRVGITRRSVTRKISRTLPSVQRPRK